MPFTFSHPAAIVPLLKRKSFLSQTGLIVGSISPDFEYFLRMKVKSHYSHTLPGIFYFDLPLAIFAGIFFHQFIKTNLTLNSPQYFINRINPILNINFIKEIKIKYLNFSISIIIGAFSHILWDDFTHSKGFFVGMIPFLKFKFLGVFLYRWVQHLSSVIGIIVCFIVFHKMEKNYSIKGFPNFYKFIYWLKVAFISTLVMGLWYWAQDPYWYAGDVVAAFITSGFMGLSVIGVYQYFKNKRTTFFQ